LANIAGQRWWRRQGNTKPKTCSTKFFFELALLRYKLILWFPIFT
jgi:hypothetical protein